MTQLAERWRQVFHSLWFVPACQLVACILLAFGLIEAHAWVGDGLTQDFPRLFGGSPDGARSMLSAIATSVVTVAGVVFSITIVALSLASTQYSPRVLRHFMDDRPTQAVLGAFVGIYAYCLVVLRAVGGVNDGVFMPSLAVLGGVILALIGVGMLIFFIHHVAASIQASTILERIAVDAEAAIDHLFPQPLGEPVVDAERAQAQVPQDWCAVASPASGYVTAVADAQIMKFACRHDCVVRMSHQIGDFVIEGKALIEVSTDVTLGNEDRRTLAHLVTLANRRTVQQDACFGLQQLVDVAVKALSPGINDPTTATMCIDRLGALMSRVASRHIPSPFRKEGDRLRVIAAGPDFEHLASTAFDAVIEHSRGDQAVLWRLVQTLESLAKGIDDPRRQQTLRDCFRRLDENVARTVASPAQRGALLARIQAGQVGQ